MKMPAEQANLTDLRDTLVRSAYLVERLLTHLQNQVEQQEQATIPTGPGFALHGQWQRARNASDVMVKVLQVLARADTKFPAKYAQKVGTIGRTRRYVAEEPRELYPSSPHLASYCREFAPGWYVGTNESNETKMRLIRTAAQVAGLEVGHELRVRF